jgi:hypothetical protein
MLSTSGSDVMEYADLNLLDKFNIAALALTLSVLT